MNSCRVLSRLVLSSLIKSGVLAALYQLLSHGLHIPRFASAPPSHLAPFANPQQAQTPAIRSAIPPHQVQRIIFTTQHTPGRSAKPPCRISDSISELGCRLVLRSRQPLTFQSNLFSTHIFVAHTALTYIKQYQIFDFARL